jgi:hypothetical protein
MTRPLAPTTIGERQAIARVLASFDYNCSVPEYNKEMIDKWWSSYLPKVDLILAALRQTLPIHLAAAIDQNDAMRQELAHVGDLVSDLARRLRVDQANDDGTWPDLAGRIQKLIGALPIHGEMREALDNG